MRRFILLITALLLIANVALAGEPKTPRGVIMVKECKQIDPKTTGFSCEFYPEAGEMVLRLHERQSKMSPERRKLAKYEFNKVAVRYFELGGKSFEVRADFWSPNQRRLCAHAKGKPYYVYGCDDYTAMD